MIIKQVTRGTRLIEWQTILLISIGLIGALAVNSVYAQNGKSSLNDKVPKHLPLKIKFEKAETEDLLATINVKVTNTGNKPIYFLLLDIVPTDITDNKGIKFSFRLTYGEMKFYTPSEYASIEDKPILPGESTELSVDPKVLEGWNQRLDKDKKLKPKHFEFNFRFLSFGDGSGFWSSDGQPFSGRLKTGRNGELIKKSLIDENQIRQNKIDVKKSKSASLAYLSTPFLKKAQPQIQNCQQKPTILPAFFINAKFSVESLTNPIKSTFRVEKCGCPDEGCEFYKNYTLGCCPYPQANSSIPYYEVASCNDYANGFCSKPVKTAEPFYCDGGGPETGNGCYGFYLEACSPGPPPPFPSGGGGGGGGVYIPGNYCTPYY